MLNSTLPPPASVSEPSIWQVSDVIVENSMPVNTKLRAPAVTLPAESNCNVTEIVVSSAVPVPVVTRLPPPRSVIPTNVSEIVSVSTPLSGVKVHMLAVTVAVPEKVPGNPGGVLWANAGGRPASIATARNRIRFFTWVPGVVAAGPGCRRRQYSVAPSATSAPQYSTGHARQRAGAV